MSTPQGGQPAEDAIYEDDDGFVQEDNSPSVPPSRGRPVSAAPPAATAAAAAAAAAGAGAGAAAKPKAKSRPHSAVMGSKNGIPDAPTLSWAIKKGQIGTEDLAETIAAGILSSTYRSDTIRRGGISPVVFGQYDNAEKMRDAFRSTMLETIRSQVGAADAAAATAAAAEASRSKTMTPAGLPSSRQRPHSAAARLSLQRCLRTQAAVAAARPQSGFVRRETEKLREDMTTIRQLM